MRPWGGQPLSRKKLRVQTLALLGFLATILAPAQAEVSAAAVAEEVIAQVRAHLPRGERPLDDKRKTEIRTLFSKFQYSYYAPDYERMRARAGEAIAGVDVASANADSLALAAMRAAAETIGHHTRIHDLTAPELKPKPLKPQPLEVRDQGGLTVLDLPVFARPEFTYSDYGDCKFIVDLLKGSSRGAPGLVMDLRGNEGGAVMSILCIASLFVKPETPLFTIRSKTDDPEEFVAETKGEELREIPLVLLVDRQTDNGGLLLAAALQACGRAKIVGSLKDPHEIEGTIHSVFVISNRVQLILPFGEMAIGQRSLSQAVHLDLPAEGEEQVLLAAARGALTGSHSGQNPE
jgi:hypothetical protein